MNISIAQAKLIDIKYQILRNKKIDVEEAKSLLKFIDDYVKLGHSPLFELSKSLNEVIESNENLDIISKKLVKQIDSAVFFLKIENFVETILVGMITFFTIYGIVSLFK